MIKTCPICGKEFSIALSKINDGKGKYCSLYCYNVAHYKDITNMKFGKLTAIKLHHQKQCFDKNGKKNGTNHYWLCKCDCGNECIVNKYHLLYRRTTSCGCLHRGKTIHNLSNSRIYKIWGDMKNRCSNKNNTAFKFYGERGITVCNEWQDFKNFYDWSINNGYNDNLTIDRINVNGNYEPNNCRWVDINFQQKNKRTNRFIKYNGKTLCLSDWATKYNISYKMLCKRLKDGWDFETAINTKKLTQSEAGKRQKTKKVYCNEIDMIFNNALEAENYFIKIRGKKISGVARSCKSSYLKAGGYKWYYYQEPKKN